MDNLTSYLFAHSYSALSPVMNMASVCKVNGLPTACPSGLWLFGPIMPFAFLAIAILTIAGLWKVFTKAGEPGWASIVPIYNIIVMLKIIRKPIWWILLYFIPIVSIIVGFVVMYELAKSFGKGVGYALGLVFLPFVFYPMLGFGEARYAAPATQA